LNYFWHAFLEKGGAFLCTYISIAKRRTGNWKIYKFPHENDYEDKENENTNTD